MDKTIGYLNTSMSDIGQAVDTYLTIHGLTWNSHTCCCGNKCGRERSTCNTIHLKCKQAVIGDMTFYQVPRFCARVAKTTDALTLVGLPNIRDRIDHPIFMRIAGNERIGRIGHGNSPNTLLKLLGMYGTDTFNGGDSFLYMGNSMQFMSGGCGPCGKGGYDTMMY